MIKRKDIVLKKQEDGKPYGFSYFEGTSPDGKKYYSPFVEIYLECTDGLAAAADRDISHDLPGCPQPVSQACSNTTDHNCTNTESVPEVKYNGFIAMLDTSDGQINKTISAAIPTGKKNEEMHVEVELDPSDLDMVFTEITRKLARTEKRSVTGLLASSVYEMAGSVAQNLLAKSVGA